MLTTGANVAGYRIERVLGVDGMGAVYLATNVRRGETVYTGAAARRDETLQRAALGCAGRRDRRL
jgi:hypothetical protein